MALRSVPADVNAAFALDANALAGLKQQAKTAPGEALSKAAGQFEALFLQMVIKSMREALPQDGPLASDAGKSYTAMFDQQLALKLSERGIGLRQALEKQLARSLPGAAAQAAPAAPASDSDAPARKAPALIPRAGISPRNLQAPVAPVQRAIVPLQGAVPTTPGAVAPAKSSALHLPEAVRTFIEKLGPAAEAAAKALGVPAHFLLAQAGLETGWGRHQPRTADGSTSFNMFGIKAGRRWTGATVEARTTEYVNGSATPSTERFRAYGSYAESFQDFVSLLRGSPRYASALGNAQDAQRYAQGLQQAGYATDPAYADKLTRAIAMVTRHADAPNSRYASQVPATRADSKPDRA